MTIVLDTYGVPTRVKTTIEQLSKQWKSVFTIGGHAETEEIQYCRGLFQGDALLPLLFCMCVSPMSKAAEAGKGYKPEMSDSATSSMMFVDDLKTYASNEGRMD